jgi:hypothetical protein
MRLTLDSLEQDDVGSIILVGLVDGVVNMSSAMGWLLTGFGGACFVVAFRMCMKPRWSC